MESAARFEDAHALSHAPKDIGQDGIFPKDPDLEDFLVSGPAIAAGLQLQHAFEAEFTKQDCMDMIENYAAFGGDGGLTESTMRAACGLAPRDVRANVTRHLGSIVVDDDDMKQPEEAWKAVHKELILYLLERREVSISLNQIRQFKPRDGPSVSKEEMLEHLADAGQLLIGHGTGKNASGKTYTPILRFTGNVAEVLPFTDRQAESKEYLERYCVRSLSDYIHGYSFRKENALILGQVP